MIHSPSRFAFVLLGALMLSTGAAQADTRFRVAPEVPFDEAELRAAVIARTSDAIDQEIHIRVDGRQLVLSIGSSEVRVALGTRSRAAALRLAAIVIVEQLLTARVRTTTEVTLPTGPTPPPPGDRTLRVELSPRIQRGTGDLDATTYQGQLAVSVGDRRKGIGIAAGYAYMPLSAFHVSQHALSVGVFGSVRRPQLEARLEASLHRYAISGASEAPIVASVGGSVLVPVYRRPSLRLFGVAGVQVFPQRVRLTSPILGSTLHTTPRVELTFGLGVGFEGGV